MQSEYCDRRKHRQMYPFLTRRRSDKSCLGVFFLGRRLLFEILLAELGEEGLGFAGTKHQYISIIFNL